MWLAMCPGPEFTTASMAVAALLLHGLIVCATAVVFALVFLMRRAEARRKRLAAEYSLAADAR